LEIGCPSSVEIEGGRILTAYHVWARANGAIERQCLEGSLYRM
jgi:hypothetical protein